MKSTFRAIIVGGGPVGLTAAHGLSKAGIDFILLERQDTFLADVGASLVLWPHGLRVLAQLGLYEALRDVSAPLLHTRTTTLDGFNYKETWTPGLLEKNHGTHSIVCHRAHLVKVLFEELNQSAQSRIHVGKKVVGITTNDDGVQVSCADGTTYDGSIIIGADGAHSQTRFQMRELALKCAPNHNMINDSQPYLSTYRALWFTFPRQVGYEAGDGFDSHGKDASLQFLNAHDRSWVFIYERLREPTREYVSYTDADVQALADRHKDMSIGGMLCVRDVFPLRYTAGMANLEEGIVKHWSWGGRVVLVGDAAHKMTPNQGLGFNNGIQDIVALVNGLRTLSQSSKEHNAASLDNFFSQYQRGRMKLLTKDYKASAGLTRMSAWHTGTLWLLDRYILPLLSYLETYYVNTTLAKNLQQGLVLDFVSGPELFIGRKPWAMAILTPPSKLVQ